VSGGRIYHWKHGWIPLSPAALRYKLGQGPRPTGKPKRQLTLAEQKKAERMFSPSAGVARRSVKRDQEIEAEREFKANVGLSRDEVATRVEAHEAKRYASDEVVDGVRFITYKPGQDPLAHDHGGPQELTMEQKKLLADQYNRVMKDFPDAEPVRIVGVDGSTGAFGITAWDGRRISISSDLFSDERRENADENWAGVGAVAAQYTSSRDAFARVTLVHELGHALQMQRDEVRRAGESMAREKIQPRDLGIEIPPNEDKPDPFTRMRPSEIFAPRWAVDTLGDQSAYATANEYEWFAEAFAEGWLNGRGATESGKRTLDLIRKHYSGQLTIEEDAA
jgi:hypothetical protein